MTPAALTRGFAGCVLGLSLLACGETAERAPKATPGPLCANCVAGGETTDFAGTLSCFPGNVTPVEWDSSLAQEFGLPQVMQWLEQPKRSSLQWRRGAGGSAVRGYQPETELTLQVEALSVTHVEPSSISAATCSD